MYIFYLVVLFAVATGFLIMPVMVRGKKTAVVFAALALCVAVFSYKYGREVIEFYAHILEANPDWHCGMPGLEAQCNGSMIFGHFLFLVVNAWNLVVGPAIIFVVSLKKMLFER